jgi:hypothetical protein
MSVNRNQLKIIPKPLYLQWIYPVQQIRVHLRSSAVNILLIFIQLTGSLNHYNRYHYTKPLKLQNATALYHDSTNIMKKMRLKFKTILMTLVV